jgi:protein-disulfide isomerase
MFGGVRTAVQNVEQGDKGANKARVSSTSAVPAWLKMGLSAASLVAAQSVVAIGCASCQSQSKPSEGPASSSATSEAAKSVELSGVDTSKLTPREKEQWSSYVSQLLAPCTDQPVSIQQCVSEKRSCDACLPAAQFLVSQVTAGKSGSQVESAYRVRFSADSVANIDVAGSPFVGPADAPVTIVEWADFECPACSATSPILDKAVEAYPQYVRLVYKHFPLSMHEHAEGAARAAVAAQKQGKFWQMHHAMFANQSSLDDAGLVKLATEVGLDLKEFDADRRSEAVADAVSADRKAAEKLVLRGTPSVFINGRLFDSDHFSIVEDLHPWIELEVKLKTGRAATATAAGAPEPGVAPATPAGG